VGISLAELDTWDAGSIRSVATAATNRADHFRDVAHNQDATITNLEWQGLSADAAAAMAQAISATMNRHADECDQISKDVSSAASDVESIKAAWARIQRTADGWGIIIDVATGSVSHHPCDDPDEQAEAEHHMQIVYDAIVDLLRRADSTDQSLATSLNSLMKEAGGDIGNGQIASPEDARQTVEKALAGNTDAAAEVKAVLGSINADQRAGTQPLTPLQASVLSQMQAQQNGMSVDQLASAEQGMGDSKSTMSDSWQLMSNPNVQFPKTEHQPGSTDNPKNMTSGGFGQLPTSVQNTLNSKGMSQLGDMTKLTNIVKDGSAAMRQGTALDRGMLNKATEMMNSPTFHGEAVGGSKGGTYGFTGSGVQTANDVLATAGGDHQAVHDILRDDHYKDNFMHGALTTDWGDDGKAVGDMFSWTGEAANGPDARLAAETASSYGAYAGIHEQELMRIGGDQTLGQLNPLATQGLATGLAPYIPDIAGISDGTHAGFDTPDTANDQGERQLPIAKGIFAVLSTDPHASDTFNSSAYGDVIDAERQYADDFKNGVDLTSDNRHLTDAMTVKGLADSGIHTATDAADINTDTKNAAEYATKKSAYDLAFAVTDAAGAPGTDLASQTFEGTLLGDPPKGDWQPHNMSHLNEGDAGSDVLNALMNRGVPLEQMNADQGLLAPPDDLHPTPYVRTFEEYNEWALNSGAKADFGTYKELINGSLTATAGPAVPGIIDQQQNMASQYNGVVADPNAEQDPKK
jgi:hypothetical protein